MTDLTSADIKKLIAAITDVAKAVRELKAEIHDSFNSFDNALGATARAVRKCEENIHECSISIDYCSKYIKELK